MTSEVLELLKEVAALNGEYDTEYDGRMYSFCVSCDYNEDKPHSEDCVFKKAQKLLQKEKKHD